LQDAERLPAPVPFTSASFVFHLIERAEARREVSRGERLRVGEQLVRHRHEPKSLLSRMVFGLIFGFVCVAAAASAAQ
jgi:hypothetical protein